MKAFSAKMNVVSSKSIENNQWIITADIVDNTGNFFARDVKVNDIIYMDGSAVGCDIFRYVVKEVIKLISNVQVEIKIEWETKNEIPFEPITGLPIIIGEPTEIGLITMPSMSLNSLDESFINAINNFENKYIISNFAPLKSPIFKGKPIVPTPDDNSKDGQVVNSEWVSEKFEKQYSMFKCFENVPKFKIVYINEKNEIGVADVSNVKCSDKVIGISLKSGKTGESIPVKTSGEVINDEWSFKNTGDVAFVGYNGDILTDISKLKTFVQRIGTISNTNSVILDIEETILL